MRRISLGLIICLFSIVTAIAQTSDITEGSLYALDKKGSVLGQSPLKHTKVKVDISGFLARVTVEQEFENNFNQPIEAVYTFPLSQNSAVDNMTMKIGSRVIRGTIKKREEARKIYEDAKSQGRTASLLDQQRPNIFTQAVANILPNEKIVIEISYVETLKYADGSYEFVFPMVVGPRYSPSSVKQEDVAKVTPPVALNTRAGHDVSIEVNLDAGVPIENISSTLHKINTQNFSSNSAKITLRDEKVIPNKDFILKYDVTGKRIEDAILTHRTAKGGFFTMMLSPPDDFRVEDVSPKEIFFVLDTSGSMGGFPIEKAKEAMKMSLEGLYPNDTFNLITFEGDIHVLFDEPVPATPENLAKAQEFLESRSGSGGTEMMKAIKASLKQSDTSEHLRIVNFMTDGYVSNESEIIAEIQKHPNARVFSFGIGNSVNRFLLDKMSEEGRGEVEYVSLQDDGSAAAKRFHERIRNPLLTDISIDWNGMPVADVYPKRNPDLFDVKPVVIYGRYTKGASGTIRLKGKVGGQDFMREIKVDFPERQEDHDVLATLWARTRIDDLTSQMSLVQSNDSKNELLNTITNIGLEFRLLTQNTSFIAVEETVRTEGGNPVKVEVPVELADGTFGEDSETDSPFRRQEISTQLQRPPSVNYTKGPPTTTRVRTGNSNTTPTVGTGSGNGRGRGTGSGNGTGVSQTITVERLEHLPRGVSFSTLLKTTPGVIAQSKGAGFSINGASGTENTFIIDGTEVTNFRTGGSANASFPIDSEGKNNFNGQTIQVKSPEYPSDAKKAKAKGIVRIQVSVDENGNVSEAKAISGSPWLTKSAEDAAKEWKFAPAKVSGVPVKLAGEIVFEFVDEKTISLSVDKMRVMALDDDQKLLITASKKMQIWVFEFFSRTLDEKSKPTANESQFVKGDTAYIQIWLTEKNLDVISKLERSGFKMSSEKNGKVLFGKIKTKKLADLLKVEQIEYILPLLQ